MSSRVSYGDEGEYSVGLWEQTARLARRGKRGQAVLRQLVAALLAMPEKRLIHGVVSDGQNVCTLGLLALHREMAEGKERGEATRALAARYPAQLIGKQFESDMRPELTARLHLTPTLAWVLVELNDEQLPDELVTPEERYAGVLHWVRRELGEEQA